MISRSVAVPLDESRHVHQDQVSGPIGCAVSQCVAHVYPGPLGSGAVHAVSEIAWASRADCRSQNIQPCDIRYRRSRQENMDATQKQIFDEQGFVIVPNLIPTALRKALEDACERVIARTRSGEWIHRRTVGRQFPPFNNDNPDSWGVQHVMHPDLGEPAFAQWYTSDPLVNAVQTLLGRKEDELQMELFNLLINPLSHAFALRWHRDDVRETATEDEEIELLSVWHHGTQWNTALYKDSCLYVVPGSHKLPRSPEQRALSSTLDAPENPLDMPGAIPVILQPGETVFYNNNILHCAAYDPYERRATLHASMGDTRGGATRARNVLQHGLTWMKEDRFRNGLDDRGKMMLDRLVKLQESVNGDLGYSLTN